MRPRLLERDLLLQQTKPSPPKPTLPSTECKNGQSQSVQNNADLTTRIHTDMAVGADAGALTVAGVIAANVFGAPEVEGGEAVIGILEGFKAVAATAVVGAGVGASGGIIFAVATTPSACP